MELLTFLPVSRPSFYGNEQAYVLDALSKMELSAGRYTPWLEQAFAHFCGSAHAMTCCNGTAGLHLALLAAGIGPGDEVIMPALTYVATANAVTYCGAIPVFCDVDPQTWCVDPDSVRAARTQRTAAILPVHLYGVPCAMQELSDIASEWGVPLIEDAAEAHGATYRGQRVGSIGDIGVFSFFGNKMITCGEGGMVVTDHNDYAGLVRLYRGQGVSPLRKYYHTVIGYNYRLTNIQSAIALAQLETFEQHATEHRRVVSIYRGLLSGSLQQQHVPDDCVSSDWMFSVLLPKGADRDAAAQYLATHGIETRPVFTSMTELPMYWNAASCPIAEDISRRGLSLPTYAGLTGLEIRRICATLEEAIAADGDVE